MSVEQYTIFDRNKIYLRILKCADGTIGSYPLKHVDLDLITERTVNGLKNQITTYEIDRLAAETSAALGATHPEYSDLAARIAISNLHRKIPHSFSVAMENLAAYRSKSKQYSVEWTSEELEKLGDLAVQLPYSDPEKSLMSDKAMEIIRKFKEELDKAIERDYDYNYDYFAFKTLEKSYLLKLGKDIGEIPQYGLMREAIESYIAEDLESPEKIIETYHYLAQGLYSHPTPFKFNACTRFAQGISCFVVDIQEDSLHGIYSSLYDCSQISKFAGGIALAVHKIRPKSSYIAGTNGTSNGLVPMLRVYNSTSAYVDQGTCFLFCY
jgi:ribonucleotide reductase alpha subunit